MSKHILIVDDDPDDCDLFCDALEMVDASVACERAFTAKKALDLLQTDYTPDYIFLDINLPLMDGKKCLAEIRAINKLGEIPIVMYTTSKRQSDKELTHDLGSVYFITKPSSLKELCNEIAYVLNKEW